MAIIKLIWCQDANGGIGKNNKLPWNIKSEMLHFKNTTTDHVVIMGRKTFDSIGKPLPNRTNVVLSKSTKFIHPDVFVFSSIEQCLKKFLNRQIYVIGGKQIFDLFFNVADELIVSQLKTSYDCDLFLDYDLSQFGLKYTENFEEFSINYYQSKANRNILQVSLDEFDGPLDLLWTLIKEQKYNIHDLDIANLSDQYLNYVQSQIEFISLDVAGEYLSLAGQLILLKSKLIFATSEDAPIEAIEDYQKERELLVQRLYEYKKIRKCISWLHKKQTARLQQFVKPPDNLDDLLQSLQQSENLSLPKSVDVQKLKNAFEAAITRFHMRFLKQQKLQTSTYSVSDATLLLKKIMFQNQLQQCSLWQILQLLPDEYCNLQFFVIVFLTILTLVRNGELLLETRRDEIFFSRTDLYQGYEHIKIN